MEALSLLCTLHADGPTSLRRLKRAGCDSLDLLERMPPEQLAEVLEVPPAVARRLGREARGLTSRLDLGLDDREEAPELGTSTGAAPTPAPASAPGTGLDRRDRALLEKVMGRWDKAEKTKPREVPPLVVDKLVEDVEPEAPTVQTEVAGKVEMVELPSEAVASEAIPVEGETVQASPATGLTGGEVDGLDASLAADLVSGGISDLPGLVNADVSRLARELKIPFAKLRRIQFLASRNMPEVPSPGEGSEPAPEEPSATEASDRAPVSEAPQPPGSEPAAPRKFWEPLPRWADSIEASELEQPVPLPPEEPTPPASPRAVRPRTGSALNWTFESSASVQPAVGPDADPSPPEPIDAPALPDSGAEGEGAAGPFA